VRAFAFATAILSTGFAAPSRADVFTRDFGAGCATMSIAGRTITCGDGSTITLHSSVTPGCVQFSLVPQGTDYTLTCVTPNLTGLWWRADESGRGTWVSHQGNTIFAIDYAYDPAGVARWRTLIAMKRAEGTYTGDVYSTIGPSFQSSTFNTSSVTPTLVGVGSIAIADADHVTVDFSETGSTRTLARQQFGVLPTCIFGQVADLTKVTNYTDLWWNPNESGWGINLAHQGDTIFAAWYTYGGDGTPMWLVTTAVKSETGTYAGDLYRTVGPAGPGVQATPVGAATFSFANGNNGTFAYSVQLAGMSTAVTQTKPITRQIFTMPGVACQ
jgi:hypothetical protein